MNDAALADRLHAIRARIGAAAQAAGRPPRQIRLIAASKTQPATAIAAAIGAGQTDFGESMVQDALKKIPLFRDRNLTWHFIGHLQSNKTRFIPELFSWVHSVDSLKLAARLDQAAGRHNSHLNVLIEVNIARDPARHGVAPEQLPALVEQWRRQDLRHLKLRGLMAMAPYPAGEAETRRAFAAVRELRDALAARFALPEFTELSMGMSGDFETAILEGATMVRVGASIFGERDHGMPAP
jgi:PLP dependent protein